MKYIIVGIAVMMIPWLLTLAFGAFNTSKIYHSSNSGKYVILENSEKLDVEDFVACVLVKQMHINEEEEALKAQAVIIRTYIYEKLNELKKTEISVSQLELEYILFDDLENIWQEEFPVNYNKLMKIVANTSEEVLYWQEKIIKPYFHNTSCGYTRNGCDVLGEEFGYLMPVQSSKDVESEDYLTGVVMTKEDFAKTLRGGKSEAMISDENPIETLQIIERDTYGYVVSLQIGNVVMTGDEFAFVFGLKSPNFQIEEYDGQIRIITKGLGHGLGLSMYGAVQLAKNGKSYVEILKHYYTGVYLETLWEE